MPHRITLSVSGRDGQVVSTSPESTDSGRPGESIQIFPYGRHAVKAHIFSLNPEKTNATKTIVFVAFEKKCLVGDCDSLFGIN